ITTSPDVPVSRVLELMRVNRISGAPVVEDEKLIGIISLENIVRALQNDELTAPELKYMTPSLVTVKTFESVVEAIKTFSEKRLGRLPVVDENFQTALPSFYGTTSKPATLPTAVMRRVISNVPCFASARTRNWHGAAELQPTKRK
ncbi:MAG: CBS domain-containing protein, partial [Chloroflexi bacterium]|nr:CBS domain-containing protein [Chloroflexota bacterium]